VAASWTTDAEWGMQKGHKSRFQTEAQFMAWLSDLSSALGVPTGGAVAAVAIYYGLVAAEREARKEALGDVARLLRDPTWLRELSPAAGIQKLFVYTFGERHFSFLCLRRSVLASLTFMLAFGLQFALSTDTWPVRFIEFPDHTLRYLLLAIGCDYIALLKTRKLIGVQAIARNPVLLLLSDVASSLLISLVINSVYIWKVTNTFDLASYEATSEWVVGDLVGSTGDLLITHQILPLFTHSGYYIFPYQGIYVLSTLMTSTWAMLMLASWALLRVFEPLQSLMNWFFPLDKHPMRAIGVVAGGLVFSGATLISVL
jgi:hypothetical protein